MKAFEPFTLDYQSSLKQLKEFQDLLSSRDELNEKGDILPFFRERKHLAALMGALNTNIGRFDRLAYEFPLMGTFTCDLVVGDSVNKAYCLIEFEDAKQDSVFRKRGKKDKLEWSPRFEHGFSQIVDWLWLLDDLKSTGSLSALFDGREIGYTAFLIVGRSKYINSESERRLKWRQNKTWINSNQVFCFTFDMLATTLQLKTKAFEILAGSKAA